MPTKAVEPETVEERQVRWARERTVRSTGDLLRCCSLVEGAPSIAFELAREGVHAARLLGWWSEEQGVPAGVLADVGDGKGRPPAVLEAAMMPPPPAPTSDVPRPVRREEHLDRIRARQAAWEAFQAAGRTGSLFEAFGVGLQTYLREIALAALRREGMVR